MKSDNKTILLVGSCGSGKTWVMQQLIKKYSINKKAKFNLLRFQVNQDNLCVLGKYDGSTFQGSDKLSMSVATSFEGFKKVVSKNKLKVICEGDRFMNKTFIGLFNPYIIKIQDNGEKGRLKRGSKQTEQHLKRISTRVKNTKHNILVKNSLEALEKIITIYDEKN